MTTARKLRAAEPRCPSFESLARHLGPTGASRDGPVGGAWQNGYETIFVPAREEWSARVAVFRESDAGRRAAERQALRSDAFERLVEQFEQASTTTANAAATTACSPASGAAGRSRSERSFGVTPTVGKTEPAYRYAAGTSRTWLKAPATWVDTLGITATNINIKTSATYWTFAPGGRTLVL